LGKTLICRPLLEIESRLIAIKSEHVFKFLTISLIHDIECKQRLTKNEPNICLHLLEHILICHVKMDENF